MAGSYEELEQLLNQRIQSGTQAADEERERLRREAAARAEAERQKAEREKAKREGSVPGRVQRGLEQWINPDIYRAPQPRPAPPAGQNGVRGMLPMAPMMAAGDPYQRFLMMLAARGMLTPRV